MIAGQASQRLYLEKQTETLEHLNRRLEQDKEILQEVHHIADVGYGIAYPDTGEIALSQGAAKLIGLKPDVSYQIAELFGSIHREDHPAVEKILKELKAGRSFHDVMIRVFNTQGEVRFIRCAAKFFGEAGGRQSAIIPLVDITQQVMDEQRLLELNRRYEQAERIASIGNFEFWKEAEKVVLSGEAKRILGIQGEGDISHGEFLELITPDDTRRYWNMLRKADASESQVQEDFALNRGGDADPREIRLTVSSAGRGEEAGYIGTLQDVTGEKQVLRDMENQHTLLRTILDVMPAGIFWMDKDLVHRGCNQVFAREANGTSPEEVIGRTDWELKFSQHYADIFDEENREILRTGKPKYNIERRTVREEGTESYVYVNKVPIFDSDRNPAGLMGVYTDITEMKKLQKQLEESLEQLRAIIDTSSDPIAIFSLDLSIQLVSPAVEHMLGYAVDECLSRDLKDFLSGSSHGEVQRRMKMLYRLIRRGNAELLKEGALFEVTMRHKEGHLVHAELNVTPMISSEGEVYSLLGIARDVTRQRMMEEHMRQSHKMEAVGRLAGGIAHDFNNMLQAILGYGELLLDQLEDPELKEMAEAIRTAGSRSQQLVSKLMLFTKKSDSGHAPVHIGRLLQEFRSMAKPLLSEGIALELAGTPEDGFVSGDQHQLEEALLNICLNSAEALQGKRGRITLYTKQVRFHKLFEGITAQIAPGEYVLLRVSDGGSGIPEKDLPHIFEPFFSKERREASSGLGLASVYAIIEQHKGFIDVCSLEGYGTMVEIYLPRREVPAYASGAEIKHLAFLIEEDWKDRKVLVAAGNGHLRYLESEALKERGCQVFTAKNGKEAVDALSGSCRNADVCILHDDAAREFGRELCGYIISAFPGIPVLFSTDSGTEGPAGTEVIRRPYSLDEFLKKVRTLITGG